MFNEIDSKYIGLNFVNSSKYCLNRFYINGRGVVAQSVVNG